MPGILKRGTSMSNKRRPGSGPAQVLVAAAHSPGPISCKQALPQHLLQVAEKAAVKIPGIMA
jgi:hypothetical protein